MKVEQNLIKKPSMVEVQMVPTILSRKNPTKTPLAVRRERMRKRKKLHNILQRLARLQGWTTDATDTTQDNIRPESVALDLRSRKSYFDEETIRCPSIVVEPNRTDFNEPQRQFEELRPSLKPDSECKPVRIIEMGAVSSECRKDRIKSQSSVSATAIEGSTDFNQTHRVKAGRLSNIAPLLNIHPETELVLSIGYQSNMARKCAGAENRTPQQQAERDRNTAVARIYRAKRNAIEEMTLREVESSQEAFSEKLNKLARHIACLNMMLARADVPTGDTSSGWNRMNGSASSLDDITDRLHIPERTKGWIDQNIKTEPEMEIGQDILKQET
ncbi:uncharacterized protein LOC129764792 [Toxorhynchites rutilus septentrionalis]|uniref:uncharacterized protein LOC129764792 n=1 Tax=Toxorhynchites rutilus septentrionalis TaxID=329112 RepID=UPI00247A29B1|nr:uncharacterized protein LOC129764792 [Toxorhynchites rutilus septentrionalis]